jgi:hypothetical protein
MGFYFIGYAQKGVYTQVLLRERKVRVFSYKGNPHKEKVRKLRGLC